MAQSFWSKRKETMNTAGGYIQATDAVSRPTAILMTIFGILLVGGLLFGIFTGTRWAYGKLTDKPTVTITETTKKPESTTTKSPSITATTSTSTTTPSTPAVATPAAPTPAATTPSASSKLPQTGAGSNVGIFITLVIIGYLAYRKKLLKN